jgi:hypothetical protein
VEPSPVVASDGGLATRERTLARAPGARTRHPPPPSAAAAPPVPLLALARQSLRTVANHRDQLARVLHLGGAGVGRRHCARREAAKKDAAAASDDSRCRLDGAGTLFVESKEGEERGRPSILVTI